MNSIQEQPYVTQAPQKPGDVVRSVLGLTFRSIRLAAGDIHYVDEGRGPTIVLLHGAPTTSLGFLRVIRALRKTYRVIAPDLPGFGYSQASPGFDGSLASYTDMVVDFCETLRLSDFSLYLNDSSGCFGLKAAARMPKNVVGIVVADTVRLPLMGGAWLVKQVLKHVVSSRFVRFLNRRFNLIPWMVATVAPWLRPFSREERAVMTGQFDTPEKRDRILDVFESMGRDEIFMNSTAQLAREQLARTPVLLLYGQFDPMRFVSLSAFRAMFKNHRVEIIPFEEHFPILASGERVAVTVHEWLTSITPAQRLREVTS